MKGIAFLSGFITGLLTLGIILPAYSQVISDGTTNTTVNSTGNNFNILNGIQKGNNLFHSFQEFSIPTGGSANFQNSSAIENIINRVTGGNISNIDGLIKANGSASVFLINPAGIVFGENARLDIGGSFVGSSAESILFEDGFEFSAVNAQNEPLLTVSVPLGLQMGQNPSTIEVNNAGHELSAPLFQLQPLERGNIPTGLRVNPGNTIALVGGNLSMKGGIINAEDGRVELGAVTSPDVVSLNPTELGWKLDYSDVSLFGDIQLGQKTLVEASNIGAIQLYGQNMLFQDSSLLLIENRSNQAARGIDIQATGTVEFAGTAPDTLLKSGVISDALNSGRGGDISISATKIFAGNGGRLRSLTFASADSGNIRLLAKDIVFKGEEEAEDVPIVEARTLGTGNSGILELNTERLVIQDSIVTSAVNRGFGSAGGIIINATESVQLGPNVNSTTLIISSAVGANGNAGNIAINTKALTVSGGALISSSTFGSGDAGSVIINAHETVSVKGSGFNLTTLQVEPTTIRTSGRLESEFIRQIFRLPDTVTGNAGTLEINTSSLQVSDGALVTVRHDSLGDAGKIQVNADSVILNNQGQITATTASGEGGNISLNLQSDLIIRENSLINTEAFGTDNGGNININSPVIAGFENSDIIANAVEGNGGNINITTQGLFGLKFREQLTSKSDITVSSQFGLSGQVILEQFDFNPVTNLSALPSNIENRTQITDECRASAVNQFVVSGRGGLPQNPSESFNGSNISVTLLDLVAKRKIRSNISPQNNIANYDNQKNSIIEATGFTRNEKGEIEFVTLENKLLRNKQVSQCSGKNT